MSVVKSKKKSLNETSSHSITKETRARNVLYRSKTRRMICEYIYEQTGCKKCYRGDFCSRDGDKWSCLEYGNIRDHLNHLGHLTSRGNQWSTTTIRRQITWGLREMTPVEKSEYIRQKDRERDERVVWDSHEMTDEFATALPILEKEFHTTLVQPDTDIELFLTDLKREILKQHRHGVGVRILRVPDVPTD